MLFVREGEREKSLWHTRVRVKVFQGIQVSFRTIIEYHEEEKEEKKEEYLQEE